ASLEGRPEEKQVVPAALEAGAAAEPVLQSEAALLRVTLRRHGIRAEELCHGEGLDKYFAQLRREREELQKADGRLTYGRMRAMLKHQIVSERIQSYESSTEGEYQPLSYWELKGYDVESIEAQAPCKMHAILGATYRVAIDKDKHAEMVKETEKKLVDMESQLLQKKKKKELDKEAAAKALQDVGFRPGEARADVEAVLQDLKDVMDQAQTRLQAAAKGKAAPAADFSLWKSEKDLNQKIKEANQAVRA
ncbi:unnamed protein product, partial [Symbiodinium sp. KB8]